ncbi:putative WD-40 repeat-containing protein [Neospora caninum Liverpool]|uniref:Putative WD-40 repeat-containing protein n=1 Tax=Neospora caninum (strain Liverpool) TaxID=572307 RepID=F0V9I3_NEOCL|nr:putative WD-40 repeat-containing protein [Neospora caninum Liverpool]CBZ50408.1 putative WD-40 repeat-containing protein [Neospora caninum Liverpool]|eukprot:XP_003880442.1 putative WD-40 repeat-containing protein [Neospora caninum Liverpool]
MSRLVSTSGRPVNPGDICPIHSTVSAPPSSPLPLFPAVPFLLHPHRPVLFWCTSTSLHAYDFVENAWLLPPGGTSSLQDSAAPDASLNHALPVAAADCVCQGCGATSSRLRPTGRREREAPRCLVGETPAEPAAGTPPEKRKNRCLWVTAGEDKYVHLVSDADFQLLQRRQQRKKLSAAVFLLPAASREMPLAAASDAAGQARENGEEREREAFPLLLADKFGDVYRLGDCWRMPAAQELAGDRLVKRMQSLASVHGLRTRDEPQVTSEKTASSGESASLDCNPLAASANAEDSQSRNGPEKRHGTAEQGRTEASETAAASLSTDPGFGADGDEDEEGGEDIPIISHLTTITVLKVVEVWRETEGSAATLEDPSSVAPAAARAEPAEARTRKRQTLLITAERDEKIRVCFLDQPWSVESFFLGHGDFVTDVVVLADFPGRPLGDAHTGDAAAIGGPSGNATCTPQDAGERDAREADGDTSRRSYLRHVAASCAGDGTVKLWRLNDGELLSDSAEVLLQPRNLFDEKACAAVRAHTMEGQAGGARQEQGERQEPAEGDAPCEPPKLTRPIGLNEEVLFPASLLYDPDQRLLIVQCLALKGLLLFPLAAPGASAVCAAAPGSGLLGQKPFFLPLPAVPAATLLVRHSVQEVETAPALRAAACLVRTFLASSRCTDAPSEAAASPSPDFDLPFVWWIDDAGRLRPPVSVSLRLLAFAASREIDAQRQNSHVLPYLSGNADDCFFPAPADGKTRGAAAVRVATP